MICSTLAEMNSLVLETPGILLQYKRVKQTVLDLLKQSPETRLPDQLLVLYIQNKEPEFYSYISNDDPFRVIEYYNPVTNQYTQYMLLEILLHHDVYEVLDEMTKVHYDNDVFFNTFLRYPVKNNTVPIIQNMVHAKPSRYHKYIVGNSLIDQIYKDAFAHASSSAYQWRNQSTISYKMPAFYTTQSK